MMPETSDVVMRFHRTLVEEIRSRRPEYLSEPFTVAEIYQNLVPYGTHRDRLGIDMNGDYEDVLLRILAGEGGYLVLESEPALRMLREELESPNPNTGLYREYAAVDVRLDPSRIAIADLAGQEEAPGEAAPARAASEEAQPGEADSTISVEDLAPDETGGTAAAAPAESENACLWCRAELPQRPNLKFCPFCGTDIRVVPCPECGEELDPEWHFCISCGTEITG